MPSRHPFAHPVDHPVAHPAAVARRCSGRARPLRQRLAAFGLSVLMCGPLTAPPAMAQNGLPALGDTASDDFNLGTERKLGDEIMRDIRRDPDFIDDPVLLEYLNAVWQPLVAAARERGEIGPDLDQRFAYELFLVRDRSVNAFALPGGFVGVHLGLIAMTVTRDELASVLAHEMTHVNQRHIARGFANSKKLSMVSVAALILGVLAASRANSPDATNAVIAGSQAAGIQGQLNFSRDMEREADRIGFQVMTTAGYSPGGMAAMFDKLQQAARLNDFGNYPYLRSHPLTTERIGEARARLGTEQEGAGPAGRLAFSPLEHTTSQARARVLMDPRVDSLRRWQAQDGDSPAAATPAEKLAAAYSSALASTLLRDWARAEASLQRAVELVRGSPRSDSRAVRAVDLLVAQVAIERGDLPRARSALAPYAAEATRPVLLLASQTALAAAGTAAAPQEVPALTQSAEQLQTWVATHPGDADAWGLLGRVWTRLGQPLRALRAEAEWRAALGDLNGAIDRLRAGQRLARGGGPVDFIEASVIDSRVRWLESQRRQQLTDRAELGG